MPLNGFGAQAGTRSPSVSVSPGDDVTQAGGDALSPQNVLCRWVVEKFVRDTAVDDHGTLGMQNDCIPLFLLCFFSAVSRMSVRLRTQCRAAGIIQRGVC
jgi:hypothetical protein